MSPHSPPRESILDSIFFVVIYYLAIYYLAIYYVLFIYYSIIFTIYHSPID